MKKTFLFWSIIFISISSCVPTQEIKKDTSEITISEDNLSRVVAVLPFQNDTQEIGIANQVRKSFYNHFSSKPYTDVELNIVDEKIIHLEKSTGKTFFDLKPEEICEAIGCDGLIYGRITDYKKVYAAVYSQLGVEAEVWMINTRTGKEVFKIKDSVRYHEGGVPMSPIGAIMTAVSTAMNIREIQQVRMVNELCYKFNEKIPSPTGMAVEEMPVIKEVLTNVKEGPFGKGKIIRVGLEGDKGMVATFDIGNFKRGIPMKETKAGIYIGEYLVMPGDNAKDMPIVASLKKIGGYESQWIDVSGFVTIDTTPPPQVQGLRARGFQDRIEISWESLKGVTDLKGYRVSRSEQPLSGFGEVGSVELNSFEDRTALPGRAYYYRIAAFDHVGNESEIQDAARASLMTKEPVVLTGELKKDTVLSGIYIVKGTLTVPKGLSLTVEPDTRVMFDDGASIISYGKLIVNGKELPVELISISDKGWKGITVDGGNALMNGFRIKGAGIALSFKNSEGVIENGVITNSNAGILISGTPSVTVNNTTISGNNRGMELIKTDAKVVSNTIIQNKEGIVLKGFSGEIRDNIIMDNGKNIFSEIQTKVGPNYLGTINVDDMRLGNVNVEKVYDQRPPGGKAVDAISNPYASLTEQERQKKAIEIVIEAGNYFRQRNYGKASTLFEEAIKAFPTAEVYYYLALCYQEMKEEEKALRYLKEGTNRFPKDSTLWKSLGMMYYQRGNETEAKRAFEEVLRLSPEDRQVRFFIERVGK